MKGMAARSRFQFPVPLFVKVSGHPSRHSLGASGIATNDGHLISSPRRVERAVLDTPELSLLAMFLHCQAIDQASQRWVGALHEDAHPLIDSSAGDREQRLAGLGRNRQLVCRLQTDPCDAQIRLTSPTTAAFGFAGESVGWVRVNTWTHRR